MGHHSVFAITATTAMIAKKKAAATSAFMTGSDWSATGGDRPPERTARGIRVQREGGSCGLRLAEHVGPKLMTADAGNALDIKDAGSGNLPPLPDRADRYAELLCQVCPVNAAFDECVLDRVHGPDF